MSTTTKKLLVALPRMLPRNPMEAYGLVYAIAQRHGLYTGNEFVSAEEAVKRICEAFEQQRRRLAEDAELLAEAECLIASWSQVSDEELDDDFDSALDDHLADPDDAGTLN